MRLGSLSADEWDRAWGTAMLGLFVLLTSAYTWRVIGDRDPGAIIVIGGASAGVAAGVWLTIRGLRRVVRVQGAPLAPLLHRPSRRAEPCPRCEAYERGPAGWCESCWASMHFGGLASSHPVLRMTADLNHHDADAVLAWFDDCHLDQAWCRTQPRTSSTNQRAYLQRVFAFVPDYASTLEVALPDPTHPGVVWVRATGTGRLRGLGTALFSRQVYRCRVEAERIVETRSYPPLG